MRRHRMALLALALLLTTAISASTGSASTPIWALKSLGGTSYQVTFTQPAADQTANAIAVQDDLKTGDPLTSMSAPGWNCSAFAGYGSYYCYGTAVAVGQSVVFTLSVNATLAASVGWQMCWSPDQFATSNCADVKGTGGDSLPPKGTIRKAIDLVATALRLEENALQDPGKRAKDLASSKRDLDKARAKLNGFTDSDVIHASNAIALAAGADTLGEGKRNPVKWINEAIDDKQKALADLRPLR